MQVLFIVLPVLAQLASQALAMEKLFLQESLQISFVCPKMNGSQSHFSACVNGTFYSIRAYLCMMANCWATPSYKISLTEEAGDYNVTFIARHMDYIRQLTTVFCIYDGLTLKEYEAVIFSLPERNICYPPSVTDVSVRLVCYTGKVFPFASWKYYFKDGNTEVPGVVSYKTKSKVIDGLRYFSVNSTYESPLSQYNEGTYEFIAVVSPGRFETTRFNEVIQVPSSIRLELPRMAFLQKCFRSRSKSGVASKNSMECMCFLEVTGNPLGTLGWFNGTGHRVGVILNQYAVMLYLNLTDTVEKYSCILTSPLKNFTSTLSLSISIKNLTSSHSVGGAPSLQDSLTDVFFLCYVTTAVGSFIALFIEL